MTRRPGPSDVLRYSHLGIQFAIVVMAALWAGSWLDKRAGTSGIFTLAGTFLGAGVGFYLLYRELGRSRRGDSGQDSRHGDTPDAHDADPGPGRGRGASDRDPGRP